MDKRMLLELEKFKLAQAYLEDTEVLQATDGKFDIPVWKKTTLTVKEAAAYSNIGINKLEEMLRSPKCTFVLFVGTKKLVKRQAFEEFIANSLEI